MRLVYAAILLAGCRVDVSLGELPTELGDAGAQPDLGFEDVGFGDAGPVDAIIADSGTSDTGVNVGSRLVVQANADVMCVDGWAGREEELMVLTPTQLGLRNGPIVLTFATGTSSTPRVSGQALVDSFGLGALDLELAPPDVEAPPDWYGIGFPLFDAGPLGMVRHSGIFVLDLSTGVLPVSGIIGVELGDAVTADACFFQFQMQIDPT